MKKTVLSFIVPILLLLPTLLLAGISDGLVAYYPFDGNADDASGNGHHGTLFGPSGANTGGPALTIDRNGIPDSAYDFDGEDDRIDTTAFDITDSYSISLWVSPDNPARNSAQTFFGKHRDYWSADLVFGINGQNNYQVQMRTYTMAASPATSGWQHLVIVVEKVGGYSYITLYKNGTFLYRQGLPRVSPDWSGKPWTIGQEWDSGDVASDHFDGKIDELRFYNRPLEFYEIEMLAADTQTANSLRYLGRMKDGYEDGEGNLVNGLSSARSVTVSPDGSHLYAAGFDDDSVAVFSRNISSGALTFVERIGSFMYLYGAASVTVSPDGSHLYAAVYYDDAVAGFSRDSATGALTSEKRVRDGYEDGEGNLVDGLDGARSVTVSPDGSHLYAAGYYDDAVAVFSRNPATGALTFVERVKDGEEDGEGNLVDGLHSARSVTVSPDGSHLYVAGSSDDAVAVFSRNPATGALTFVERVKDGEEDGEGNLVDGLNGAQFVTVSPDGSHLYVAGAFDDAVAVFSRNTSTGALTFVERVKNGKSDVDGLDDPRSVTVSPDGSHLYVAGYADDAVAVFNRNTSTGALTFLEVVKDGGKGVDGLNGAQSVTVSPDGSHLYVAGKEDDAVAMFGIPDPFRTANTILIEREIERQKWDANGDNKIGLEEVIRGLEIVSGENP